MSIDPRWRMSSRRASLAIVTLLSSLVLTPAATGRQTPARATAPYAPWIEPDFPFFSSVLDAGRAGQPMPARNLTPRALVLNLGQGHWAAFDVDLLRVAAIWKGNGVTPRALAPGSYQTPDRKTPGGQSPSPEPEGNVWLANGIYPGWQSGQRPTLDDPREPAPTIEEVGRGPLPEKMGRFQALRLVRGGAVLEYVAGGADIREWIGVDGSSVVRQFDVGPSVSTLWLMMGFSAKAAWMAPCSGNPASIAFEAIAMGADEFVAVRVPARREKIKFCAGVAPTTNQARPPAVRDIPLEAPASRWSREVTTSIVRSTSKEPFVVDHIGLPFENPWRRNVRVSDVQFMKDGVGATVTLDGDVWIARGLQQPEGPVTWRRFASGLHEPLSLAIRDDQIYVFDRNGIWRLRDTNGDGEADLHELFSNAFAQTADMREFPSMLRAAPNGEFVIAKGGQEETTIGKHNGSILRVSADGRTATVLGYGFRQPNISVNPRTGLVLASDQQGHYIPTTPLHIVRDKQFYGFLSDKLPREVYPAPIAEPLTWIPHAVNASAMSQIWTFGARMGPLNDGLVHIGFNNPELFRVLLNERGKRLQAAVVSVTRAFEFPPLHGSLNPVDGQLYIAGFQIMSWGTTAPKLAGLGRVRYTGAASTLPREIAPMDKGVLVSFDVALDWEKAVNRDNYTVTAWNYQRTYRYGSPQFKADGTPGIDRLAPSAVYLSKDGRRVFVALPELARMKKPMQMRVGWSLATSEGKAFQDDGYFTPYELTPFDPRAEGFGDISIDMTQRTLAEEGPTPVSAEEGAKLYTRYGCVACHAIDAPSPRLGPNFKGLFGSSRLLQGGVVRVTADEAYLKESILQPTAKVVTGFNRLGMGMPSFAGVLTDAQLESVILYIKSLK